jgi:hypothetical protein
MKTYLLFFCVLLFLSCNKQEESINDTTYRGKIVGYLKCSDNGNKSTLFGIYIISNKQDSLLAFNVPSSMHNIDTSKIENGIKSIDGDSISFKYKEAEGDEIKQYDCPATTLQNITFYDIDNFIQAVIISISKIQ